MEKKASTFLLLIIIAVQTLIVAALAVFVFVVGVNPPNMSVSADSADGLSPDASGSPEVVVYMPPPDEADLATVDLFGENKYFNLKSDGDSKNSVIVVNVSVKYFTKLDGIKNVTEKMNLNKANLQEIVGLYFQSKTLDEIKEADTRIQAKDDLKREMNDFLLSTIDKEKDRRKVTAVIYDVAFSGWTYQ